VNTLAGQSYENLRLSDDGGGRFALDVNTGVISTTRSLDYDSDPSSYQLAVAVDTEEGAHFNYISVGLNEINQAPTHVALVNAVSSLVEDTDTSSRIKLADIQVTDDGVGSNTVSLTGSAAASFEVLGTELYLKADELLDYESQGSYTVTVRVEDTSLPASTPVTADLVFGEDELDDVLATLEDDWQQAFAGVGEDPFSEL
jgi:hypothetical protein